jgi:hypothetical protein
MTAEQNKALVRRLLDRIRDKDKWDPAVLDEFFAATYRRYLTPTTPPLTAGEHRERAARLRAAFPTHTPRLKIWSRKAIALHTV